jgi:hypothetical protein
MTPSTTDVPGLRDFVIPQCICTDSDFVNGPEDSPGTPTCSQGRWVDITNQQQQGSFGGLENGLMTVADLIAFADSALATDCARSTGVCGSSTCATAFDPDDPIRIGEIEWALRALNECFSGHSMANSALPPQLLNNCTCKDVSSQASGLACPIS